MNRQDFIDYIARENNMTKREAKRACDAVISGIRSVVLSGGVLSLRGFGCFYLTVHKGHPTQFRNVDGRMPDYLVFKFSPSHALHRSLRDPAAMAAMKDSRATLM